MSVTWLESILSVRKNTSRAIPVEELWASVGGWGDENETLAVPSEDAAPVQPSLSPPSAAGSWVASSAGQPGGLSGTALGDMASP